MKKSEEFEQIINGYSPIIQELASVTREFIFNFLPCPTPKYELVVICDNVALVVSYYVTNYLLLKK